jgi:hypothetical protein
MDSQDIINIFVLIILLYLVYQNNSSKENFTAQTDAFTAVNQIYGGADIQAIRNLSVIAKGLMDVNGYTVPGALNVTGNIGTHNTLSSELPTGWTGGVSTFDVYAKGSIKCNNGIYGGGSITGTDLLQVNSGNNIAGKIHTNGSGITGVALQSTNATGNAGDNSGDAAKHPVYLAPWGGGTVVGKTGNITGGYTLDVGGSINSDNIINCKGINIINDSGQLTASIDKNGLITTFSNIIMNNGTTNSLTMNLSKSGNGNGGNLTFSDSLSPGHTFYFDWPSVLANPCHNNGDKRCGFFVQ